MDTCVHTDSNAECLAFSVRSISPWCLLQRMLVGSMDVTVRNKKKKRKPGHFSMLANSKDRMVYDFSSNGGVAPKP